MDKQAVYAHFIGVGGAGMSGIALVLHERGLEVTGSDLKESGYTRLLRDAGISVSIGHAAENLGDPEVVVVSSAIPDSNPELAAAVERGIPVWPRAKMLAEAAGDLRTIAVAGTHGKTTTSSMTVCVLRGAGSDPTFLIGGELNDVGSNASRGSSDLYVVEADESDGSFLHLCPELAVVTNVEADHLDHYGTFDRVVDTFSEFFGRVPSHGTLVVCADDELLVALARNSGLRVVTYGLDGSADLRCQGYRAEGTGGAFEVQVNGDLCCDVTLRVPGIHNAVNATGALAAAWTLGLDVAAGAKALGSFGGVRRRFDTVGVVKGVTVVDDYAHHPTEIRATLGAAEGRFGRIWSIFQPHRYSRTAALGDEFAGCFEGADKVVVMDVYSAGETPIPGVSGKTIVDAVLHSHPRTDMAYFPHRFDVAPYLASRVREGDLVLTLGAGDITDLGSEIVRALGERGRSL